MENVIPMKPTQEILEPLFPKTYRAIEKAEKNKSKAQWEIGDCLVEECPKDPDNRYDGSIKKIEAFSNRLISEGYEKYTPSWLISYRTISSIFPECVRTHSIPWSVYSILRSKPDLMQEMAEKLASKQFSRITVQMARGYLTHRLAQEKAERELIEKQRLEEEQRKIHLQTKSELKLAEKEAQKLQIEPIITKLTPPEPIRITTTVALSAMNSANQADRLAIDLLEKLSTEVDISKEAAGAIHETAMKASQRWLEVANKLRKTSHPLTPIRLVANGENR